MGTSQHSSWLSVNRITFVYIIVAIIPMRDRSVDACISFDKGKNYGETSPPDDDITLHVGQPLELFCSINLNVAKADGFSVENLVFYKTNQLINSSYVVRVNKTTIRLYMENQPESTDLYYCFLEKNFSAQKIPKSKSNDSDDFMSILRVPDSTISDTISKLVCLNWVSVGLKPREVDNYSCISLNWQALDCSWSVPKNVIRTIYSIKYAPNHRYSQNISCPTNSDEHYNFCTWTLRSSPMYCKNVDLYKIIITGKNKLGISEQVFIFNQYEHIIMDEPKNFQLLAKNSTSATLQWDIGHLQYFPKPITYKMKCISLTDNDWQLFLITRKNSTQNRQYVAWTMTGLTPKMDYLCHLFIKSSLAADKYWSTNYAELSFRTD